MKSCSVKRARLISMKMRKKKKNIPRDVFADILSRLPITSLVRFGCASKLFRKIISDREFQHSHFNRSLPLVAPNVMALTRVKGAAITINLSKGSLEPPANVAFAHILTSRLPEYANTCNGLLCFRLSRRNGSAFICNPITGDLVFTPKAASADNYSLALGFSPSNRKYKILRLSSSKAEVCVVGSKRRLLLRWREIRGGVDQIPSPPDRNPVYVSGKVYWICGEQIVTFDVAHEVFLGSPPHPEFGSDAMLVELGGNLSLVDLSSHSHIRSWVLKDQWEPDCFISTSEPIFPLNPRFGRMIGMWAHQGILLILLQDQCIVYDPKTKQKRDLLGGMCPLPYHRDWWEMCCGYRMSLVSLKTSRKSKQGRDVTFARNIHHLDSRMQFLVGCAIGKMGIVLKLLPDYARAEPCSLPKLVRSYTRAARADRGLLGPHIHRPLILPPNLPRNTLGEEALRKMELGEPMSCTEAREMIHLIWMGK